MNLGFEISPLSVSYKISAISNHKIFFYFDITNDDSTLTYSNYFSTLRIPLIFLFVFGLTAFLFYHLNHMSCACSVRVPLNRESFKQEKV